ncbi:MAG: ribbon-helix-helix protein, CopG family [Gammaproteobacteria bacterium]|nr:ribbon-helix-helix protein, CopG family [Gammaproteobacteria bacterium]
MLAIRLPPEIEQRLTELATQTGRTKTYYARQAILLYLDDLEDTYLALKRLERPVKRWTLEEVEQELDLEG